MFSHLHIFSTNIHPSYIIGRVHTAKFHQEFFWHAFQHIMPSQCMVKVKKKSKLKSERIPGGPHVKSTYKCMGQINI